MNLTDQDKKTLGLCLAVAALTLAAFIFVPSLGPVKGLKTVYADYNETVQAIEDKQTELEDKKKKLAQREQHLARIGELEREIEYYESRLPTSPRLDDLLEELNDLARISGQNYIGMKRLPIEPKSTHIELPLQITLFTDYHGLGNFINMIENSERFSKIDDLVIEGDKENPGRINVELTLSTFRFVEPQKTSEKSAEEKGNGTE